MGVHKFTGANIDQLYGDKQKGTARSQQIKEYGRPQGGVELLTTQLDMSSIVILWVCYVLVPNYVYVNLAYYYVHR